MAAATTVNLVEVERRVATFSTACKRLGLAVTPQRLLLFRTLAATTGHPSADELFEAVRPSMPSLSLATVYKNLTTFRDHGLARAVHTSDGVLRFDAHLGAHHHLECRGCGSVADVEDPALDEVSTKRAKKAGFKVESHQVVFLGLCAACARRPAEA